MQAPHYSEGVLIEMVWLSGVVDSFAEAEAVFERIGHLTISDSSIWRRKETWGAVFKAIEEAEREKVHTLSRAAEFRGRVLGAGQRIGLGLDGTLVHIRNEGWKELKVGCSFDLDVYPTWNPASQEWEDLAHAVNNHYVAHLGGPEVFGQLLWVEAQRRGWEQAADREVVGDGAAWVWNVAEEDRGMVH